MENLAKILIADENTTTRQNLRDGLLRQGYRYIEEAVNGEEALMKIGRHHPDIVIADVWLSKLDGIGVLRQSKSMDMGADKPAPAYFERCFARIPGFDPKKAMIVGDSLSSDIQGGINAGILTCHYNRRGESKDGIVPSYTIDSLEEIPSLLEKL